MTLEKLQENVDMWIRSTDKGYFSELTNLGVLTEEVGELARWMIRKYGDQTLKPSEKEKNIDLEIKDELADILWVTLCLANQMGINMQEAMDRNFDKKNQRDASRHK